jgi:hypothetical protein
MRLERIKEVHGLPRWAAETVDEASDRIDELERMLIGAHGEIARCTRSSNSVRPSPTASRPALSPTDDCRQQAQEASAAFVGEADTPAVFGRSPTPAPARWFAIANEHDREPRLRTLARRPVGKRRHGSKALGPRWGPTSWPEGPTATERTTPRGCVTSGGATSMSCPATQTWPGSATSAARPNRRADAVDSGVTAQWTDVPRV